MSAVRLPRHAALFLSFAIAAPLLSGCGRDVQQAPQGATPPPPPRVSVAEVVVRDVTPWMETSGRLAAMETVEIRPRVGGLIQAVSYREGSFVKQGELLFLLDQRPFRAELDRAEAALSRAHAEVELARAESRRARALLQRELLSPEEYDQRVAAEARADAGVRAAEAAVRLARLNLEYTEVRSPIAGRAGRALKTRGNLVAAEPTPDLLSTVVSLDPIYVYFGSDELSYLRHAGLIRQLHDGTRDKGPTVLVGLSNETGFTREGHIDFIDNRLDPATGSIRIRAVLGNTDHALTPGLFARVKILGSEQIQAVLVSEEAILTDQDRRYVYVLGPGNSAVRRDVQVGQAIGGLRAVTGGLQPGDRVIVYGVQKVFFPGMTVTPLAIRMGDPPPPPDPAGPPGG